MLSSFIGLYARHTRSRAAATWRGSNVAVEEINRDLIRGDVSEILLPYPDHDRARLIIRRVIPLPLTVTIRIDPHNDIGDQGYGLPELATMLAFALKLEEVLPYTGHDVDLSRLH